jgi:hypothetical protein
MLRSILSQFRFPNNTTTTSLQLFDTYALINARRRDSFHCDSAVVAREAILEDGCA